MRNADGRKRAGAPLALAAAALALIAASYLFFDRPLAALARGLDPALVGFFGAVTVAGRGIYWVGATGALAALLWLYGRAVPQASAARAWARRGLLACAVIAAANVAGDVLKLALGRARPVLLVRDGIFGFFPFHGGEGWYSMPSGHAVTVTAAALLAARFWPRGRWLWALAALVLLASRVVVGAHYPADVLAGALVAWLAVRGVIAAAHARGLAE